MKQSTVRELLKVAAQPDMISFAGGLPAPELFPVQEINSATEKVLREKGARALQYAETEGAPELRDWIAQRFSTSRLPLTQDNVLITSGGQQALDLIGRILLNPGDKVLVENPTYLALLSAWRPLGADFLAVESDQDGLKIEDLKPLLKHRPKLLYTVPNFQNPQGTTLSRQRREAMVKLLREQEVGIIEDNPYGDLRYEGEDLPHLLDLDASLNGCGERNVIYVGTFSKIVSPGLRVGWVIADKEVIIKLTLAKQAADLHTSTFNQLIIHELLRSGFLERQLPQLCQAYGERRDTMLKALSAHFPDGASWSRPEGGMFLLATLPPHLHAADLLSSALEKRVAFVPGDDFHLNGRGRNTMRLNFSNTPPHVIAEGIKRLAECLHAMMEQPTVNPKYPAPLVPSPRR